MPHRSSDLNDSEAHLMRAISSSAMLAPSWYPGIRKKDAGHASMATPITCQWRTENGATCGHLISVVRCAEHLRSVHGVAKLAPSLMVKCHWCPNGARLVRRANLVRHVREVHLHHSRRGPPT